MPTYTAPVEDMRFVLQDYLGIDKLSNLPAFEQTTPDLVTAILEEAGKLASEVWAPLNQTGDKEGCTLKDGVVTTPTGFKDAYDAYVNGGWSGLTAPAELGGQGLPYVLGLQITEMMIASNWALSMYPYLTRGAIDAIATHGNNDQKRTYLPKMVSGEWSGTMNLTEPHAGTDLGLLRTKAEPQADGSYRITGTKIFISAGEHDLTENIIHLVLAKIPGGPDGSKGISMFIVPKFLLDENGNPGKRNGVTCGALEHKMGIHGNATCVLNYEDATGWLVGEEHGGLKAMFTMMNEARLGVGMQGLAIADVANQNAAIYARDRLQMRSISGKKNPDGPADPIIVHPDVRRMLMTGRAFCEGARALASYVGLQADLAHSHPDEDVRQKANDLIALMTPVIKAYYTDMGVEVSNLSLQVFGGHGYIWEHGMEQFARDSRIAPIYEGTNGVQALDLVGRKLAQNGGRAVQAFLADVQATADTHKDSKTLGKHAKRLMAANGQLQQATMWLMQNGLSNPDNAGAASVDYLKLMALVALGQTWLQLAKVAQDKLAEGAGNKAFYENKLITAQFFFERMLPDTAACLSKIEAGADSMMALAAESF